MPKSEAEIIREADESFHPSEPGHSTNALLAALETFYLNGATDEMDGDVEAPTGHFYRVDRWIVVTDSQGFRDVQAYDDVDEAQKDFNALTRAYDAWGDDGA